MNRRRLSVALRVALGIGATGIALVLVAGAADVPSALTAIVSVDPRALLLPVGIVLGQFLLRAVRWTGVLRAMTGRSDRLSTWTVANPLAIGYLANALLPARIGEVFRLGLAARRLGLPVTITAASVVVERALDLMALLLLGSAALYLVNASGPWPFVLVVVTIGIAAAALPLLGRVGARLPTRLPAFARAPLAGFLGAVSAAGPGTVARTTVLSGIAWSCDALVVWLCANALGAPVDPAAAVLIAAGAAIGTALPAAAGYLGTYELGALVTAGFAGVAADTALRITLLVHAIAVIPLTFVGLIALVTSVRAPAPSPDTGVIQ